jgi:hypothetical protein
MRGVVYGITLFLPSVGIYSLSWQCLLTSCQPFIKQLSNLWVIMSSLRNYYWELPTPQDSETPPQSVNYSPFRHTSPPVRFYPCLYFLAFVDIPFQQLYFLLWQAQITLPLYLRGHDHVPHWVLHQHFEFPSGLKYFGTFFCVAGNYSAFHGLALPFHNILPHFGNWYVDPAGSETISWVSITVQGGWCCASGLGTSAGLLRQIYTDHKTNHDLLRDVSVFLTLQTRRAKSKRYVLVHPDGVELIFVSHPCPRCRRYLRTDQ